MGKCYACSKIIYDDSRSYRKRLEEVRKIMKDEKVDLCDCCIGKFNKTRNRIMMESAIYKLTSGILGGR